MIRDLSRRHLLGCACCTTLAAVTPTMPLLAADAHEHTGLTPDEALAKLREGNASFVAEAPYQVPHDKKRRLEIAVAQKPFVVLVGCSDSRVPPELLFGRGLGELFIVRVAGNTVDEAALGSIEYAVGVLGVPLIVVLGHERCGAVQAAVDVVEKNATFPGSIGEMIEPIIPAVLAARGQPGDLLDNAVSENVRRVVKRIHDSEAMITEPVDAGKLRIVGARYDLDDGKVDFFA